MPEGDLLMPMYGRFKGDGQHRVYLTRSIDQGRTWSNYASIAYAPHDPNPQLPGWYNGYTEPSVVLLPNGQLHAMIRAQYAHYPGEYRPMDVCWSSDRGKTWTKPTLTKPQLMNICPKLEVLDNGVVACEYGRPGLHVAFSLDNGRTWRDRVSLTQLPANIISGQFDMVKTGPNRLLVVGSDGEGTKVWPITVERVKVSPASLVLTGKVTDEQGMPIVGATVERGPNRYALDAWQESDALDQWNGPLTLGVPELNYQSIREENAYPTVKTDEQGQFRFESVGLEEYVLTVEAPGFAPQHRHINVRPDIQPQIFSLKPGRSVRGQVVDDQGKVVPGACVLLDKWHTHTDTDGYFHWSVEEPLPSTVTALIHKKYSGVYGVLEETFLLSRIEQEPIVLPRK